MNSSEYTLSMKEFATICHTTRDTLRHYYENKIIEPYIDPDNGYHYYSPTQVSTYYHVLALKNIGYSLSEIKSMMNSTDPDFFRPLLFQKTEAIKKKIAALENDLNTISTYNLVFEGADNGRSKGKILTHTIPDVYIIETLIDSDNAYNLSDITLKLSSHIARLQNKSNAFPVGATIDYQSFMNRDYRYSKIFSISLSKAADITNCIEGPSHRIITYTPTDDESITDAYKKLEDHIKKDHIDVKSDLFIINLVNLYGQGQDHSYLKYLFFFV